MLLKRIIVDKLSRPHKINENSSESWIGFKSFNAQLPEVENVVLKGSDHRVNVP